MVGAEQNLLAARLTALALGAVQCLVVWLLMLIEIPRDAARRAAFQFGLGVGVVTPLVVQAVVYRRMTDLRPLDDHLYFALYLAEALASMVIILVYAYKRRSKERSGQG